MSFGDLLVNGLEVANILQVEGQWMEIDTGIWVAAIGGTAGLVGSLLFNVLQVRVGRRKDAISDFSRALSDALEWVEFAYIIHRRHAGADERGRIGDQMNDLQQRLKHHQNWLRIESSKVHSTYSNLLKDIKRECAEPMRAGWVSNPSVSDSDMNLGELISDSKFDQQITAYVNSVKSHLRLYLIKVWR